MERHEEQKPEKAKAIEINAIGNNKRNHQRGESKGNDNLAGNRITIGHQANKVCD